jgi:hypothetical protein
MSFALVSITLGSASDLLDPLTLKHASASCASSVFRKHESSSRLRVFHSGEWTIGDANGALVQYMIGRCDINSEDDWISLQISSKHTHK